MSKFAKLLILLGIAGLLFSYYQTKTLPPPKDIIDMLYKQPQQSPTDKKPFTIKKGSITYLIRPLYSYEISGLVVSYHNTASWLDYYHARWKDSLNIKDLGLCWGDNIKSGIYTKMRFSSGSWTLYYKFKPTVSRDDWKKFKYNQFSNNHLLTGSQKINQLIMDTRVGDQVWLKGYLVEYEHSGTFKRGTSTTRNDKGQGACETVFVTDYKIIKKSHFLWHYLYRVSKYCVIAGFVLLFLSFIVGPLYHHPKTDRF
jgi:hypothetical protein